MPEGEGKIETPPDTKNVNPQDDQTSTAASQTTTQEQLQNLEDEVKGKDD